MNNQEQIGEDGSSQEQIRVKRSTTIQVYIRENSRQGYFGECIGDYRSRQEQVGVYRIKWQQLGVDRSRYNYIRLYRSRQEKLGVLGVAWSTRSSQEQLGLDRNKREYIKVDRSRQKWIRVNIIIKEQLEVDKSMSMQEQIKSIYEYQGEARSS